jgi:tetratricopeptide (TPR) repeat protein
MTKLSGEGQIRRRIVTGKKHRKNSEAGLKSDEKITMLRFCCIFPEVGASSSSENEETDMFITTTAIAALLVASAQAAPSATPAGPVEAAPLASKQLAEGRSSVAIAALEQRVAETPDDPALLINLGIAHAQEGEEDKARAMFERALVSPEPIELETASGEVTDSRRLARKAIRMLERGDFATQITRRD